MKKKFYIDPGHGGESIGASYKSRKEQDDCLRLSLAVKAILLTQKNVEVMLSREDDTNPALEDRAREANEWGADYFLSVHRNAFAPNEAKGVEAWCYSNAAVGGTTYIMAATIVNDLCVATSFVNRGVKVGAPSYTDYAVNRLTNMSSCLLEVGFIDSDSDNAIFDTMFSEIALSIAKSLLKNAGLEYIAPVIKNEDSGNVVTENSDIKDLKDGEIYILQAGVFSENAKDKADSFAEHIKKKGFDAYVIFEDGYHRVRVGAFEIKQYMLDYKAKLEAAGIEVIVKIMINISAESSIKEGDIDGDGKVTASDARSILRSSVGLEEVPLEKGDIDGDGKITSSDAREALRISTGLEV